MEFSFRGYHIQCFDSLGTPQKQAFKGTVMAFVMSQHETWNSVFSLYQRLHIFYLGLDGGEGSILKSLKVVCSGRDNRNMTDRH